ncbi:AAA family ATPase [Lentzea guizhouensis]|uniref:AAA family ATPase n=1 Tax=Lentzea guizhouensis TaxID=1586287 RepID=UPI000AD5C597|nr:ATP-binding protein [Lentzea guizhouensis]
MVLLERASELRLLTEALDRARAGHGDQFVISGPLGCGKSALLDALAARAHGFRVLTATCAALERDFAFGVARQLLDPVLSGASHETGERWFGGAAGLARVVFCDDEPAGAAFAVQEAAVQGLTALICAISADQPTLVVVDDLQWADDPSLRWLAKLTGVLAGRPVLVVVTTRDGEPRPVLESLRRNEIRPQPLSRDAVAELVERRTGQPPDPAFVTACLAATGGTPLFLCAVLLHVTSPTADQVAHVRELRPARLIERLVRGLATQSRQVQDYARAAATLGDDDELAGPLAGLDPDEARTARRVLDAPGSAPASPPSAAVEESMTVAERECWQARAVRMLHDSGRPAEQVAARLLAVTTARTTGRSARCARRRPPRCAAVRRRPRPGTCGEPCARSPATPPTAPGCWSTSPPPNGSSTPPRPSGTSPTPCRCSQTYERERQPSSGWRPPRSGARHGQCVLSSTKSSPTWATTQSSPLGLRRANGACGTPTPHCSHRPSNA